MRFHCSTAAVLALAITMPAQTILAPFNTNYTYFDLGSVAGVSTNYGGLAFLPGNPNALLLCGAANTGSGVVYLVPVVRAPDGHITSFGAPTLIATAPYNDGGLCFAPNGVLLFAQYPSGTLGEIKPGSVAPDKVVNLNAAGLAGTLGACQFVPSGYPAAGRLKLADYSGGGWYDATLVPDANGTFDIGVLTPGLTIGGGPEGILFPPAGSPGLVDYGYVLVNEYGSGNLVFWNIDANADPISGTRQVFMSGLGGAEGAALDPVTRDFLFTTYGGGNRIIQVRGFGSCGTFTHYGTGGPGTGNVIPAISGTGCPRVGSAVQIDVTGARPNSVGILVLGSTQLNVPFLNFSILTDLGATITSLVGANGTVSFPLAIPNGANVGNITFYWQAGYLDPGAPQGMSATNGLSMFVR